MSKYRGLPIRRGRNRLSTEDDGETYTFTGPGGAEYTVTHAEMLADQRALLLGRKGGGAAPKHNRDLQKFVDRLVAGHPEATARELWGLIPKSRDVDEDASLRIYRDQGKVVVVRESKGGLKEKPVTYKTFRTGYVRRAKKKS